MEKLSSPNFPYLSPTPGRLPLIGTGPSGTDRNPTMNDFVQMSECGLNASLIEGPTDDESQPWELVTGRWRTYYEDAFKNNTDISLIITTAILKYAGQDGDGITVGNWRKRLVELFKDEMQLGGWQMGDEPLYDEWGYLDSVLPLQYEEMHSLDPNHMTFFNLAATDKPSVIGPNISYENYLKDFQNTFLPAVWSYDYYAVRLDTSGTNYVD